MSTWGPTWLVRVELAIPGAWPRTTRREFSAETPARLRALVEWARASRRVLSWKVEQRRSLIGTKPEQCRHGHPYSVPGSHRYDVRLDWLVCPCGGHGIYTCETYVNGTQCGDQITDPPISYDCDARSTKGVGPVGPAPRDGGRRADV